MIRSKTIYWKCDIIKISVLNDLIYRFSAILFKFLASCFVDIDKLILKFTWRREIP